MKRRNILILSLLLILLLSGHTNAQVINTIAGTNIAGLSGDTGPAILARLFYPTSVACDISGNLYISDAANRRIRKISTSGIITTVVGSGCGFSCAGYAGDGGPATMALLYYPNSVSVDSAGNLFIADYGNNRIRKVNTAGIISTYAGNGATSGYSPDGVQATSVNINFANVALDGSGNIYFGTGYHIRKVNTSGIISSYAGIGTLGFSGDGGPATAAQLSGNGNVAADAAGNLFITDNSNYRIRKVNTAGIISTIAGNGTPGFTGDGGPATAASINPFYVSLNKDGEVFITDQTNHCIRKVDTNGIITTIAGTGTYGFSGDGGPASNARLYFPGGVVQDPTGAIIIADGTNNRIRKIGFGNHPPHFDNGHSQSLTVCEYSVYDSISFMLSISDSDNLQMETWGTALAPAHGTLYANYAAISNAGSLSPSGLYYTPAYGYTGPDSFKIKITDGLVSDTTTIHISVNVAPGIITGLPTVCIGMTTLLADTTAGGSWSSSNPTVAVVGSSSGAVFGISAGVVNITYTPLVGCFNTKTVTVTPVPTVISGVYGLCNGASATLTDSIPGGTWSCSSPWIATIDAISGLVVSTNTGVDTFIYTMSPGCSVSKIMTVDPIPSGITGPTHLCPGATITLSDATSGGAWFSSNNALATIGIGSGVVTGVSTGPVTITYSVTIDATCISTMPIMVDSMPALISGPLQVCPGASVLLTDFGGGIWSSGTTSVATIGSTTGVVSGIVPGTSIITYAMASGCSISAILTVNTTPAPISGVSYVCQGAHTTLVESGSGTWSSSNTGIATISSAGLFTGVSVGNADISYTNSLGCAATLPVTVAPNPSPISGPGSVCIGAVINLTDFTSGGIWSGSPGTIISVGSSSGAVTGVAGGTGIVDYTTSYGCTSTTSVNVNPLPSLFTVSGGGSYCAGGTGLHIGLTGSLVGTTYQLNNGAGPVSSLSGTGYPLDFGLQTVAGTYTVTATITTTSCTRLMTGSAIIIINPLPPAITGPSAVCVGATMTLTGGGGGSWLSSNPGVASIGLSSGIVTGVTMGIATITYTLTTSCYVTFPVTVSSTPSSISGSSTVCAGSTSLLTDSIAGGIWSSSNTALATIGSLGGLVTGVAYGPVTITYSLGTGCTKYKYITVNPVPVAISGSLGVCTGHLTSLTDATPGGTWSSFSPGIASIGASSGIVSGIVSGTTLISYTLGTGCAATAVVSVNTTPSAISGTLHVCEGLTSLLGNLAGGGIWSSGSSSIATIGSSSGVLYGVLSGITTVTYSLGSGCFVSTSVTVNTSPAPIGGPSVCAICAGTSMVLTETTSGGTWVSGNPAIATVSGTGIVYGVSSGLAVISYTYGLCSAMRTVTVNPLPLPVTGVSVLCASSTATFTDPVSGGTWSSSAPGIATVDLSSGIVTGITAGNATITYTLPTGCYYTKPLTINPLPAPITGGSMVCIGSSIPFTDSTPGGAWSVAPGGAATVTPTGVVNGVSLGTSVISYMVAGCTALKTVSVNGLPPGITGLNHVCSGSTIILSDPSPGGVWSSGLPAIASVGSSSGLVTGGSPGSVLITYSIGPGCIATTTISVIALPSPISGPSSLCTGSLITLTDTASGGTWSSSNVAIDSVGPTGIVKGMSGGVATISYSVATGCSATRSITSITAPPIIGIHNLCAWGDTMNVSDANTTGIYTSTYAIVTNLGGGLGRVSASAPGVASVTYQLPSGCITTSTFTVNPLPNLISGVANLCVGDSLLLSDVTAGGYWSTTGTGVATIGSSSGRVRGVGAGTAVITYTLAATGCKTDTTIIILDLPIAGIITGVGSLCAGSTVALTDSVAGGIWSAGGLHATVTGGVVSGISAGADTVIYAVTNMCGTTDAIKPMTVNPVPAVGPITGRDSMCVGNTVLLSDSSSGGIWSAVNPMATVSVSGLVTGITAGMDTILYTLSNAWCSATSQLPVKVIAIDQCGALIISQKNTLNSDQFSIWPNPTDGKIVVSVSQSGLVTISNVLGSKIAAFPVSEGDNIITLSDTLAGGIYFIEFDGTGIRRQLKFVLSK